MHICVISHSYPTTKTIDFVFVDQLCRAFADKGLSVTIIAPQSLSKCLLRNIPIVKFKSIIITDQGNKITLYRPLWYSFGNRSRNFAENSFKKAIHKALRKISTPIEVIYGHFWAQAIAALPFAKKYNIPLFAVAGEGELDTHKRMTIDSILDVQNSVKGAICVATKSMHESINSGFATEEKCIVIPNAINPCLFYKRDKNEMRRKYGFPLDAFIVVFVGQWNSRKGVQRLSKALTNLNNPNIKAFFIGHGAENPTYENTIFQGKVDHDILPEYLNCADIFALPTINEGCSNAIIEAMACGLPIISSNMAFNWDVLNETNSILFDPLNINQISNTIKRLYDDEKLRSRLTLGALKTAADLTITARADKIIKYIKSRI